MATYKLRCKILLFFTIFFSQNKNLNLIKLTHSKHLHSKIIKKLTKSKNLFSNSKLFNLWIMKLFNLSF